MYKEIRNEYFFTLYLNNELYFFPELENYIKLKILVKRIKPNSLKTILSSLKSFIIWSLANTNSQNEQLVFYLSRYLSDCENGFEIYDSIFIKELNERIDYKILSVNPKQPTTIDKDKALIEDFLKSTNQELFKSFNLEKNIKSLNHSFKNSVHDGYGLRMGSLAQKAFANDISIIPPRNKSLGNDFKSFPYQLFNSLIEISSPREKLIYLLCGACSARISQALNLTLYDFDYKNKHVWLIDPRSNDQLGIHGIGRKTFLKDVYNIDATKDKPHSNIGFKAPIPLRFKNRIPLYWISDIYRNLFFDTLAEYKFLPESSRIPKHPFFFGLKCSIITPNICLKECNPKPSRLFAFSGKSFFNFSQWAVNVTCTCCGVNLAPLFVTKKKGCFGILELSGKNLYSAKVSKNKLLYISEIQYSGILFLNRKGIGALNPILECGLSFAASIL